MLRKSYVVAENQRGLLVEDGRIVTILEPGRHTVWDALDRKTIVLCNVDGLFNSPYAEIMAKRHSDLASQYLEIVHPDPSQVAVIHLDGRASHIVRPGEVVYVWKVLKEVRVEVIDVGENPRLTKAELRAFETARASKSAVIAPIATVVVPEASEGLVFRDGEVIDLLGPGRYAYWTLSGTITLRKIDLRPTSLEVTAQEILTRDRVSLRVTLSALLKVTDVRKLAEATADHEAFVYKLVQFAVREAVGGRTLDQVLSDRVAVDTEISDAVRAGVAEMGFVVNTVSIKDVILPGEMRTLINTVVAAEKTAEANLIRRREEVAATRSLLNTARLMDENPTLLRLKELETLEKVTEKIGRIDVHASNGEGLNAVLDRLVSIKSPA